jgi:hypothetical protein
VSSKLVNTRRSVCSQSLVLLAFLLPFGAAIETTSKSLIQYWNSLVLVIRVVRAVNHRRDTPDSRRIPVVHRQVRQ